MTCFRSFLVACACLALLAGPSALAAEGDDTCTGYIDSLPTTITTAGTWCLRSGLNVTVHNGAAVNIAANDVTLDCLGHTIDGMQSGYTTGKGVYAQERHRVTVRNCTIIGLDTGIHLYRGNGHRVHDNLLDRNLRRGIQVWDPLAQSHVARNRVIRLGGAAVAESIVGIEADAEVIDNVVAGVTASSYNKGAKGIIVHGTGTLAARNHIRDLLSDGPEATVALTAGGRQQSLVDNHIGNAVLQANGVGISGANRAFCSGNHVAGYTHAVPGCDLQHGNLVH